jgi:hypothetical protein
LEDKMGIVQSLSKRWLVLVAGLVILFLAAVGILALLSGQADVAEPTPVVAEIQLNPSAGQPGTTVTVVGSGWQPEETVLVYLVEVESNATDGAIYASTLANREGRIAAEFDYPQILPWAAKDSTIVEARGLGSRRAAQALFQVRPSSARPTSGLPTSEPPETQAPPPTPTPTPVTPTEMPIPPTPTATPVPPTPKPTSGPPTSGPATAVPPTPTPAPPAITDWRGEYYDNRYLTGSPRLVRNDKDIDFQWGAGSPAAGLSADDFSVRWTRGQQFPAGSHRFIVEVDDGARLWVDGQLVIDQWHDGIGSYTGDIYLTEGMHDLRLEVYEHTGEAKARLWWSLVQNYPDWKGEYFTNRDLAGSPRLVRNDPEIAFDWGAGSPSPLVGADNFGVRWTRSLDLTEGSYRFTVEVDDGARLWVDGQSVIDQWHDGIGSYTGDIYLTEGLHGLRLEVYEHTGEAKAYLGWALVQDYPDWKGEYFTNRELVGSPRLVRNDPEIAFDWGAGSPSALVGTDNFGVRWTRFLDLAQGLYQFCVQADDGVRVQVDDIDDQTVLIEEWRDGPGSYCAELYITGGRHKIRVEYYEHLGDAAIQFGWQQVVDGQMSLDAVRPIEVDLWAKEPAFVALSSADG